MANAWRSLVALGAAVAAVVGLASSAQAYSGFTAERYNQIQFGMTKEQVWQIGGGAQACEDDGSSILCWSESSDYAPYGGFSFTSDGKLYRKWQEFLFKPKTPSMTLAKYNKTQVGMTETQLWSIVSQDSCVVAEEKYSNWPATNGHVLEYYCTAKTGLFPPNARFQFTDGALTWKKQYNLT